jgi:hypothetical protein
MCGALRHTWWLGLVSCLLTAPARADLIFSTPTGSTVKGDGSVSAEARFTLGNGTLDITLSNLEDGIKSSGQAISALLFDIDGKWSSPSLSVDNAVFRKFLKKGSPDFSDTPDSQVTRWKLFEGTFANGKSSSSSLTLDVLTGTKPQQLILGDGPYPKKPAGSLFEHGPYVAGSATFRLEIAGITPGTRISNVRFQFGTGDGASDHLVAAGPPVVTGDPLNVPEPSTLAVGLLGVALALGHLIRDRRGR